MSSSIQKGKHSKVLIAEVSSPFGVRGAVKLRSHYFPATELKKFSKLFDDHGHHYLISVFNIKGDLVYSKIKGVETREEADKLKNKKLYINREDLPNIKAGEYYSFDLIGLIVKNNNNKVIGIVQGMKNFGASDLLEVVSLGQSFYHPFTKDYINEVNLEKGYLVINIHEEIEVQNCK